eukprot:gene25480-biopygen12000
MREQAGYGSEKFIRGIKLSTISARDSGCSSQVVRSSNGSNGITIFWRKRTHAKGSERGGGSPKLVCIDQTEGAIDFQSAGNHTAPAAFRAAIARRLLPVTRTTSTPHAVPGNSPGWCERAFSECGV